MFVDGIGSKGLSCLFLGMLVALLPRPGVLALSLATLFLLNVITSGQVGLVALVFVAVTIALHEVLAAGLGVTTGPRRRPTTNAADWSFAIRAGLAIGLANALAALCAILRSLNCCCGSISTSGTSWPFPW